jgi:hypothetical protein
MSFGIYALLFIAGASAIAGWAYVRFPRFAPQDVRRGFIHAGASMVVCQIGAPLIGTALTGFGQTELRLVFVIGVALPALSYAVLSFVWLVALIQGAIGRGRLN